LGAGPERGFQRIAGPQPERNREIEHFNESKEGKFRRGGGITNEINGKKTSQYRKSPRKWTGLGGYRVQAVRGLGGTSSSKQEI